MRFLRALNDELRATVHEVERLTPTIVEVVVRAPLAARALPARASSTACRTSRRWRARDRRHAARDGRPRAHRRMGRPRAGARLDDRARDGRLVRPVRAAQAGRAGRAHGADRARRPRSRRTRPWCSSGGGLGNAVLFSIGAGVARRGIARAVFRRLQEACIDRYKVAEIEAAADVVVWCCDEAPGFTPTRPQDRTLRRQHRAGDGTRTRPARWASSRSRCTTPIASSPSAPTA